LKSHRGHAHNGPASCTQRSLRVMPLGPCETPRRPKPGPLESRGCLRPVPREGCGPAGSRAERPEPGQSGQGDLKRSLPVKPSPGSSRAGSAADGDSVANLTIDSDGRLGSSQLSYLHPISLSASLEALRLCPFCARRRGQTTRL
jgi:hypothetical protein